ncbi:MAG: DUF3786 domain-containing protein [Deltaproteobacteria bacterium]|nr:DUF3786 domain-containing protein [Deltaproteobacteria bacterium]MBW2050610.1 DUF3786 domain-containing protein [Deltaproteobacteria bacterium]MBW2139496.1 DUF3786 domain-containing protein [Deltaproteobacteria bacterium]MBW2322555.1 DUF3786 domain-containing protein [Deltaproteobacteria bacterium]
MSVSSSDEKKEPTLYHGIENLPPELWSDLAKMDPDSVSFRAAIRYRAGQGYILPFLGGEYIVDQERREITGLNKAYPVGFQAGLVMLCYLIHASEEGLSGRMVTEKEIKGGSVFFQGPHALSKKEVLERYARDGQGFLARSQSWDASSIPQGDAAFRILVLPKILAAYILYEEDDEFPARLVITFDASIEKHLPLDAIFAMVNVISHRLIN